MSGRRRTASETSSPVVGSPFAPLRHPYFATTWSANVASNMGSVIQLVGASWLMMRLSGSPDMVALVQSATSAPVLFLGLLAGVLADTRDRRLVMLTAQIWMLGISLAIVLLMHLQMMTPVLLLGLTFLLNCGVALSVSSWHASTGDRVVPKDLAAAIALNSVGFNIARSLGPAVGGLVVSLAGVFTAFVINALSYVGLIVALLAWRPPPKPPSGPREPMFDALFAGLQYVQMARFPKRALARAFCFALAGSSIWALTPIIARDVLHGDAGTYGLLLSAFGAGATVCGLASAAVREKLGGELTVRLAAGAFAILLLLVGVSTAMEVSVPAVFLAGGAWILVVTTYNISLQLSSPGWVLGRAISLLHMSVFGGVAIGSWGWGSVATHVGPQWALAGSAVAVAVVAIGWCFRGLLEGASEAPAAVRNAPGLTAPGLDVETGRIAVTVERRVSPENWPSFLKAMRALRRIRTRDGAMNWALWQSLENPTVWIERFELRNWAAHLRQRARATDADTADEQRVLAFHEGPSPPVVSRYVDRHSTRTPVPPREKP